MFLFDVDEARKMLMLRAMRAVAEALKLNL